MKHLYGIFLFCALLISCASDTDIAIIDLHKEYPAIDLQLSDMADVSYIPLKGKDSAVFKTGRLEYDNAIYIDSNYIFIADSNPVEYDSGSKTTYVLSDAAHLYMFDSDGNFIRTVVNPGKEENQFFGFGMNYTVHPAAETITVHGTTQNTVKVFDFNGNYKGTYNLGKRYYANTAFNDTVLFVDYTSQFIRNDGSVKDNGKTLMYYNINTKSHFNGQDIFMSPLSARPGYTTQNKIVRTNSGAFLVTPRTDTIYHISNNLNVTPKFVTIWQDAESDHCIIPIAETGEYILFSTDIDYSSEQKGTLSYKTYLLNKKDNQFYRINTPGGNSDAFEKSIFSNELLLGSCNTTQTPNTLAYMLPIKYLKENHNSLPDKLKQITASAKEDDNPVLMIVKFREQISF